MERIARRLSPTPTPADFSPPLLRLQRQLPLPWPRLVLRGTLLFLALLLAWAAIGRLDIVAVAQGRLVPMTYLKVVQPADAGIVRELRVREGDRVAAGQVLVRMDTHLSEADHRQVENDLAVKSLQLRRVEAELAGTPLRRLPGEAPHLFAQADHQWHARRQSYLDALAAERALLTRAEQDYSAALQQEEKLARTAPLAREQETGWNQLVREGYAGRLLALDKTKARIDLEQELAAQRHGVAGLKAAIDQSRGRIAQIESSYRSQLMNERVELDAQRHKLKEELDKQSHRYGLLELKAPQDGVIKDLATHTQGTVVQPGTILMTLVPEDEPLQAEVWIANADAGFVRAGQAAKIKLATYPFQKFGLLDGQVVQVSPDASDAKGAPAGAAGTIAPGMSAETAAGYRALVALKTPYLEADGVRYRLSPGMQLAVEIHLGTRSVLEYLLSPVRKVAHEAGRER